MTNTNLPFLGTVHVDVCSRCGRPPGLEGSMRVSRLCLRCARDRDYVEAVTRAYVARIKPNVSPTCPYDAIEKYEREALEKHIGDPAQEIAS